MTQAIWKFPFSVHDRIGLTMPHGAKPLTVQMQNATACLWALVDVTAPVSVRKFRLYGTGHEHDEISGEYVGTFQMDNGALVFHLFEETS